jgi:S1-C subfamily serine protease
MAGLRDGDVILAVGGTEVTGTQSLIDALSAYAAGERVSVTVLRGGSLTIDVEAVLQEMKYEW